MKGRAYSILYLGIMILYILRPSLPWFEYIISKEYIEKNLCIEKNDPDNSCHGKCYLHEQLTKSSEQTDNDRNDKIAPERKVDDHLITALPIPGLFAAETVLSVFYLVSPTESNISEVFIPPRI